MKPIALLRRAYSEISKQLISMDFSSMNHKKERVYFWEIARLEDIHIVYIQYDTKYLVTIDFFIF